MKLQLKIILGFMMVALLTAVGGVMGVYFSGTIGKYGTDVGIKYAPLADAAMEIKLSSTTAHLLFEEIVSGDEGEDVNDIWESLDEAIWYCDAILEGGENNEGKFFASDSPEVRAKITETRENLVLFIEAAHQRYDQFMGSQGAGSEADQQFDELYGKMQAKLLEIMDKYSQTVYIAGNSKFLLANGHLFLEELLSGDEEEEIEDVLDNFIQVQTNIGKIAGLIGIRAIGSLADDIEVFLILVNERYEDLAVTMGAGSEADVEFDASFNKFIAFADEAEEKIHDYMDAAIISLETNVSRTILIMIIISVTAVLLAIVIGIITARGIVIPLKAGVEIANTIAAKDLTVTIDQKFVNRKDEIGELAKALSDMQNSLQGMMGEMNTGMGSLSAASTELLSISEEMSKGAAMTTEKAGTVAAASEELNANSTSVAAGMEQSSTNLNSVATATEEMTATINQIAQNTESARSIAEQAVGQSKQVSELMDLLGNSANEIGKVTETIASISDQTNLLALNATIEAARAGAAGKGFAVVASEIKDLAKQTADATEDIKNKIDGIQTSTNNSIVDIKKITEIVQNVNDYVTTIASAVEEQSITTKDISENMGQASSAVQEATERTAQNSTVSQDIAKEIAEVSTSADEMSVASNQVAGSAKELSGLSERLKAMVDTYKL